MKRIVFFAIAVLFAGCTNNPTTVATHEQVVSPKALIFMPADQVKTLSITHTCTCPFPWSVSVLSATQVFKDTSGYGDNTKVPITIDRTKMTSDTLNAVLSVSSSYGRDTVLVTVYK
jgi:hypothetical protein